MELSLETLSVMQKNSVFALDPSRRQVITARVISTVSRKAKLATIISTVYTISEYLINLFEDISINQTNKIKEINRISYKLLVRAAKRLNKTEIANIQARLDILCQNTGFLNQPSWSIYVSFCLVILDDVPELVFLAKRLNELSEYMAKKEGRVATDDHIEKAAKLYDAWRELF